MTKTQWAFGQVGRPKWFVLLLVFFHLLSWAPSASSQESLPIETVLSAVSIKNESPSLSPDGQLLAFTLQDPARRGYDLSTVHWFTDRGVPLVATGGDVWILNLKTKKKTRITNGKDNSWGPVWSPDGRYLAFYSDREGDAAIWLYDRENGAARRVSKDIVRVIHDPIIWLPNSKKLLSKFLPEGQSIAEAENAILAVSKPGEEEHKEPGTTVTIYRSMPLGNQGVKKEEDHTLVVEDPFSKMIRADLGSLDVATGRVDRIAKNVKVFWYGIPPDASSLAYASLIGEIMGTGGQNRFELVVLPLDGKTKTVVPDIREEGPQFSASWSPRGDLLAFLTSKNGEVQLLSVKDQNASPKVVHTSSPGSNEAFRSPVWDSDGNLFLLSSSASVWELSVTTDALKEIVSVPGHYIYQVLQSSSGTAWSLDGGRSITVKALDNRNKKCSFLGIDLAKGTVVALLEEDKMYGEDALVAADGASIIYRAQDATSTEDWWMVSSDFRSPQKISSINPQLSKYKMGRSRLVEWRDLDGNTLHGALLLPSDYHEGTKYPMIVDVYGGSDLSFGLNIFGFSMEGINTQLFSTRGYAVLFADSRMGPETPLKDLAKSVLPGVTKLIDLGIADPRGIGVIGGSAGGYSVLALGVQSTLFNAAVSLSGTGDLVASYGEMSPDGSAYGVNVQGQFGMRGGPWDSPQRYLENSPVFYLNRMQTPLLIVQGTADDDVRSSLGDEIFVDLRSLGKEVVYAKYEGERHGIGGSHANRLDFCNRVIGWFDQHLRSPLAPIQ